MNLMRKTDKDPLLERYKKRAKSPLKRLLERLGSGYITLARKVLLGSNLAHKEIEYRVLDYDDKYGVMDDYMPNRPVRGRNFVFNMQHKVHGRRFDVKTWVVFSRFLPEFITRPLAFTDNYIKLVDWELTLAGQCTSIKVDERDLLEGLGVEAGTEDTPSATWFKFDSLPLILHTDSTVNGKRVTFMALPDYVSGYSLSTHPHVNEIFANEEDFKVFVAAEWEELARRFKAFIEQNNKALYVKCIRPIHKEDLEKWRSNFQEYFAD